MTRRKLITVAKIALNNHAGEPTDQQAIAVADAIELVLRMEETGDEPEPAVPPASAPKPAEYRPLPPSPAVQPVSSDVPQESSDLRQKPGDKNGKLIIMPDDPRAVEVMKAPRPDRGRGVEPLSVSRLETMAPSSDQVFTPPPKEGSGPPGDTVYWKLTDILANLHAHTPATIKITITNPDGKEIPVTLERNVVAGPGFEVAKLVYKPAWANDDFAVDETFSVNQRELPIGQALERITAKAKILYAPRPRYLTSHNPIKPGALTYRLGEDVHDNADKLAGDPRDRE